MSRVRCGDKTESQIHEFLHSSYLPLSVLVPLLRRFPSLTHLKSHNRASDEDEHMTIGFHTRQQLTS